MRTLLFIIVVMASAAGAATFASSAGAASASVDTASADTVAAACGVSPGPATPLNLDLIPSKPVLGHQSVRGAGDDDGCGEDDDHGGRGSAQGESGGEDD